MSVGEEAAEKIGELFGRTKAFKANMASIIDRIVAEKFGKPWTVIYDSEEREFLLIGSDGTPIAADESEPKLKIIRDAHNAALPVHKKGDLE